MNSIAKYLGLIWLGSFLVTPSLFGQAGNDNPGGVTAEFYGSITTAGQYDPYTGNARREIDDIVVPGTVGAYPLKYTRTVSTRGGGWRGNYNWGVGMYYPYYHPGTCGTDIRYCESLGRVSYPSGASYDLLEPGPGEPWYLDANGRNGPSDALFDCAKAGSECTAGGRFELRRADGGKVLFEPGPIHSTQFRAYAIVDPFGQRTTLTYYDTVDDSTIWKVTEPGGRFLEFVYVDGEPYTIHGSNGDELVTPRLLATVRANDGQGHIMESVNYGYDWVQTGGFAGGHSYRLRNVYYAEGAVATYTYVTSNAYIPDAPGRSDPPTQIHSCDDPRYAGPMKYIEYEYVSHTEVDDVARGQIKAEKNILGQRVSSTTYPPAFANPNNDPNWFRRTETRGDGPTRTINYAYRNPANNLFGVSWTDFKNQTFTDTTMPGAGWMITDPRNNTTTYEIIGDIGALKKITYPQTEPGASPATKEYTFTNPNAPYYHSGEKDENGGNWTYFDRDPVTHQVTQIHHPDSSTETFTYNNLGQVLTHTLRSGGTESFEYDNNPNGPATRGLRAAAKRRPKCAPQSGSSCPRYWS